MGCERRSWPPARFRKATPEPGEKVKDSVSLICNVGEARVTAHDMSDLSNTMKLYHTEWCPECEMVRGKLAELGLSYEDEIVPDVRPFRKTVHEVSGQYYVPVLVDGETVLTETSEILTYLDRFEGMGHSSPAEPEVSTPPLGSLDERNN